MSSPRRGENWLVDLGLAAKVRPAVVLSIPFDDEDRAVVAIVPHTTSTRGTRFEVAIRLPFLREGTFDAQGLLSVPHVRFQRRLGAMSGSDLHRIEQSVLSWLGITLPT